MGWKQKHIRQFARRNTKGLKFQQFVGDLITDEFQRGLRRGLFIGLFFTFFIELTTWSLLWYFDVTCI